MTKAIDRNEIIFFSFDRFINSMENRLGSASSSLSLTAVDARGAYYSLSQNDSISRATPSNAAAAVNSGAPHTLCMLVNGGRVQQRYKLLIDGIVQVCRVPHAKNIIEKIRFSRFLRRWEEHHINLDQSEITSRTVCSQIDI
jgi:hypothetical protein